MENQYNEQDLNFLIEKHLDDCSAYSNVCNLMQTTTGKERIVSRIKEILFTGGTKNVNGSAIDAAIANVESELTEIISGDNSES